jgi:hypothetical protein
MTLSGARWHVIAESNFAWEREALDWLRSQLPDRDPWHVWTNFEFIDDEGKVVGQRLARTVIRSVKRLTYIEAQALIDRGCAVIAKACGRELREAILAAVPPDDQGLDARASGVVCIERDAEHDIDR